MKTSKSQSASAVVEATAATADEPTEFEAAAALRDAMQKFNSGAAARPALSADDHAELDRIIDLADDFTAKAENAWTTDSRDQTPAAVRNIAELVSRYRDDTTGFIVIRTRAVAGDPSTDREKLRPVIAREADRLDLFRDGQTILTKIDAAIDLGRDRVKRARRTEDEFQARVAFWVKQPAARSIIELILSFVESDTLSSRHSISGLLDSLRSVQRRLEHELASAGKNPPAPLPTIGARSWLNIAKEILAEESKERAA